MAHKDCSNEWNTPVIVSIELCHLLWSYCLHKSWLVILRYHSLSILPRTFFLVCGDTSLFHNEISPIGVMGTCLLVTKVMFFLWCCSSYWVSNIFLYVVGLVFFNNSKTEVISPWLFHLTSNSLSIVDSSDSFLGFAFDFLDTLNWMVFKIRVISLSSSDFGGRDIY